MEILSLKEWEAKTWKSLITTKNLHKLLVLLKKEYPVGYSYEKIIEKTDIKILPEHHLNELIIDGLIRERIPAGESIPNEFKKLHPALTKPEYVIASRGIEFLNNIEVRNLSRKITLLTRILVSFGAITIGVMIIQLIFNI
jgi:hypothetical protein